MSLQKPKTNLEDFLIFLTNDVKTCKAKLEILMLILFELGITATLTQLHPLISIIITRTQIIARVKLRVLPLTWTPKLSRSKIIISYFIALIEYHAASTIKSSLYPSM